MSGIKGDFTGFSFGGRHSSDIGITRVSDGSRYNDNLLPNLQDVTAQVPGGDGIYYWGSFYTQKPFNINVAFDSLTEENLQELRGWFGSKDIQQLIFDEAPYKYYMAKVTSPPQFKYICFDEDGIRIYKGEGTIQFTCYYPYAKSVYKWLDEYRLDKENFLVFMKAPAKDNFEEVTEVIEGSRYYQIEIDKNGKKWYVYTPNEDIDLSQSIYKAKQIPNLEEWKEVSGMKDSGVGYDTFSDLGEANLYNPGIMETDFIFDFERNPGGNITFSLGSGLLTLRPFEYKKITDETFDSAVRYNSKANLLEGIDKNGNLSGNLYNEYIDNGDFFKIPIGESTLTITGATNPRNLKYQYIYY